MPHCTLQHSRWIFCTIWWQVVTIAFTCKGLGSTLQQIVFFFRTLCLRSRHNVILTVHALLGKNCQSQHCRWSCVLCVSTQCRSIALEHNISAWTSCVWTVCEHFWSVSDSTNDKTNIHVRQSAALALCHSASKSHGKSNVIHCSTVAKI